MQLEKLYPSIASASFSVIESFTMHFRTNGLWAR
jgi:hypothetical protein